MIRRLVLKREKGEKALLSLGGVGGYDRRLSVIGLCQHKLTTFRRDEGGKENHKVKCE